MITPPGPRCVVAVKALNETLLSTKVEPSFNILTYPLVEYDEIVLEFLALKFDAISSRLRYSK